MSSPKPIKRSEQLAPLSREHHDALLFSWKIKQGLKNGTTRDRIVRFAQWFWKEHLDLHFRSEEELLLPQLPANDKMGDQLLSEHARIRELIATVATPGAAEALADLVTDHVRFEERQFFPYIEQLAIPEELNKIQQQLDSHPHCTGTWEDEFWLKK